MTKKELWDKLELDHNVICFSYIALATPECFRYLFTGNYVTPENIGDVEGVPLFNKIADDTVEATVIYYVLGDNAESENATDEQLKIISEYFEDIEQYADLLEVQTFSYECEAELEEEL